MAATLGTAERLTHPPHTSLRGPFLVTGATGFIGRRLTRRLAAFGGGVRAMARDPGRGADLAGGDVSIVRADLTRPDEVAAAVEGCGTVFHCAAWMGRPWSREAARRVNVLGTRALVEAALHGGVESFVHVSTISVYGPTTVEVIDEQTPFWPLGPYRESKIGAEDEIRAGQERGLRAVVLRPGQVFGPEDTGYSPFAVRWIRAGRPVLADGGHGFCHPLYVEHLVDAALLAADCEEAMGQAFNLADGDAPWREFFGYYGRMVGRAPRSMPSWVLRPLALAAEAIAALTGKPPRGRRVEVPFLLRRSHYSTARARAVLRWTPRFTLEEAMGATRGWLQGAGLV